MPIDKSWMSLLRNTHEFEKGLDEFLDLAFSRSAMRDKILCPCMRCLNTVRHVRNDVKIHVFKYGIDQRYTFWDFHGESSDSSEGNTSDDEGISHERNDEATLAMLQDMMTAERMMNEHISGETSSDVPLMPEEPNLEAKFFFKLVEDAKVKLYPDCKGFSRLSYIVELFHLKCTYGWSNTSFDALLKFLKKLLPEGNTLPDSMYEVKKNIRDLGLGYHKIDACLNDCILYRGVYANYHCCPICGTSRWMSRRSDEIDVQQEGKKTKIPRKILRHFPLVPRLHRMFMTAELAKDMRWHKEKRVHDDFLRHPADSLAWKELDIHHPSFARDCRNVRLGLASDGFNPFSTLSSVYSTWPVVLLVYNLPPWLCMKQSFFIMSLLISGPKSPGNDIDVYLQPLIEELKELWDVGFETYDAYKKQNFNMRATLVWTINDFPAFAMLSGWSTKGELACPECHKHTCATRLKYGKKFCYLGHRRWLDIDHAWRKNKKAFDGKRELRVAPKPMTGDEILTEYAHFPQVIFGKLIRKRKRGELLYNWKKHSIFFELPYWSKLLIRHNLDVMHIEKNVCDNIIGTLLNSESKSKDNIKARLDMQEMGIRKELHAVKVGNKVELPPAKYTLSTDEKRSICQFLKDVKVPDGHASNISRCVYVKECELRGLKSHDCHVLLERLLPLILRGILDIHVCDPLVELSKFFSEICAKVLRVDLLKHLDSQIPLTLCKLEKIFPTNFFDVMEHLVIHLAQQAMIAGPVQFRWMYPIERYLRTLKGYVRNKARPEGSIAEGYLSEECMTFCARYLQNVGSKLNRPNRIVDVSEGPTYSMNIFKENGRSIRNGKLHELSLFDLKQARLYVLKNCEEVQPFINDHLNELKSQELRNVERRHDDEFSDWFEAKVFNLYKRGEVSEELYAIVRGPDKQVLTHNGWYINGFLFRTIHAEGHLKTQNSGVVVQGDEDTGNITYHGQLTNIIVLQYIGKRHVTLFKCDWFEVSSQARGYREDRYGFISLNFSRHLKTNEPYILACQAAQVYFTKDSKDPNWHIVVKVTPRHVYDVPYPTEESEEAIDDDPYQANEVGASTYLSTLVIEDTDELMPMNRTDIDGAQLDTTLLGEVQEEREPTYEDDDLLTEDDMDVDNNETDEEFEDDD